MCLTLTDIVQKEMSQELDVHYIGLKSITRVTYSMYAFK